LAVETEQRMNTEVYELFVSTETGSIAWRRRVQDDDWQLYRGISIEGDAHSATVQGNHLHEPMTIDDRVEIISAERFRLLASDGDLVQIDGKPASLQNLNHQLVGIPGVVDGVFVLPEDSGSDQPSLAALVVAPGLTKQQVLKALSGSIDASLLPRPLHLVDRLPRTATGKLPREQVLKLLRMLDEAGVPAG
jgi:acyl-coenzyme A synthetase/AMP-(fatty) acid ligase